MKDMLRAALLAVCAACSPILQAADPLTAMKVQTPQTLEAAPGFELPTLSGEHLDLATQRGQVVLLNFWATWCGPCREEMPGMQRLWEDYRARGLVLLAVSADQSGAERRIENFMSRHGLSFPVLLDPEGEVRQAYGVSALPVTFLIDRQGRMVGRLLGARDWAGAEGRALIDYLLDEGAHPAAP